MWTPAEIVNVAADPEAIGMSSQLERQGRRGEGKGEGGGEEPGALHRESSIV